MSASDVTENPEPGVFAGNPAPSPEPPLRILYAVGPGDVAGLYRDLQAGNDPAFQIGLPFSKQFLDWCDRYGAECHAISWCPRRDLLPHGPHRLENRPKHQLYFARGWKHHLGNFLYGWNVAGQAIRNRAQMVVVDSGTSQWIAFSLLRLWRIPVIAVIHATLWPRGFPPRRKLDRVLLFFDGLFFRHFAAATVCVSPECERQIRQVAGTPRGPIYQCRAQYRHGFLDQVAPPPDPGTPPFRILFLGRVEEVKGVASILEIAERLELELPGRFAWKIVGDGSMLGLLRQQAEERRLSNIVELPGRLPDQRQALDTFAWAHAVIVPTTSRFPEGLAMTAAEGALAGRPVIVSSVVPAWEILGAAAIQVPAGDVAAFAAAIRKLALDPDSYRTCQRATLDAQGQFYDRSQGLGSVLGRAIAAIRSSSHA